MNRGKILNIPEDWGNRTEYDAIHFLNLMDKIEKLLMEYPREKFESMYVHILKINIFNIVQQTEIMLKSPRNLRSTSGFILNISTYSNPLMISIEVTDELTGDRYIFTFLWMINKFMQYVEDELHSKTKKLPSLEPYDYNNTY